MRKVSWLIVVFVLLLASVAQAGTIEGKLTGKSSKYYKNAVVYIEKVEGKFEVPEKKPVINQKKMKFVPHVLPILVGTTVDFLNSDSVNHNVFSPDKTADKMNLGTWGKGGKKSFTFKKTGIVTLLCNVHPEMLGFIIVLQNPYFALTDKDGKYSIKDIPAGTYTIKVWREKGKVITKSITVPAKGAVTLDLG